MSCKHSSGANHSIWPNLDWPRKNKPLTPRTNNRHRNIQCIKNHWWQA